MKKPPNITQAEWLIYGSWVVMGVILVLDRRMGAIDGFEFSMQLVFSALLCIIPYKIGKGSNPARYIYAVLTVFSTLIALSGEAPPKSVLDQIYYLVNIPLSLYVCWLLFNSSSNRWFLSGVKEIQENIEPSWMKGKE